MTSTHGQGLRTLALTLALVTPSALLAQQGGMMTPQVGYVTLHAGQVDQTVELPGRAVAYEQADIRPRVDGIVIKKLYKPGSDVKEGDPLFQLDDASYQATVEADAASVAEAEADLPVKQAAYDRAVKLEGSGYTAADVDTAKSDLASAKATLQSAQAALKYARIQLGWTTIRSPIDGVVDVADVSTGDLVTSGQSDALTTVTTLDPIDVELLEPAADILSIRKKVQSGDLKLSDQLQASLIVEGGETYETKGELVTPSPTVSTTTGSVTVRFRFDNPDHVILPGMFLRGTVTLGSREAFLVPQRAGEHDANGNFSFFIVGDDGKAKKVSVPTDGSQDNAWIVTSGLEDGVKVIVDGQKNLQDGAEVKAVPVTITEDGTTQDAAGAKGTE
ncbi:efflux RND transporter periplasmic adaptor subunit [Pseudooceanicola sp. CBS1P-1]|uniref:Efflux RND transporter periplasmic adaptor subunit n=1 Tax=Pseudooceanicola albus TaxID=2692189 RepID=A0A6L7G8G1_9RHOB|nr:MULTISPECIES: efflux RND transporter periplasmic adaptor subunit [Pseudooceanicola]MBT9384330.1 efflux RND transporter periplasmic adaptor subunit [Pseudooceanicola endophyticus]MXN19932.1 efflux RND transporter periplasmic adaptor subunit [Pseudooceanicola albus]